MLCAVCCYRVPPYNDRMYEVYDVYDVYDHIIHHHY